MLFYLTERTTGDDGEHQYVNDDDLKLASQGVHYSDVFKPRDFSCWHDG